MVNPDDFLKWSWKKVLIISVMFLLGWFYAATEAHVKWAAVKRGFPVPFYVRTTDFAGVREEVFWIGAAIDFALFYLVASGGLFAWSCYREGKAEKIGSD